MIVSFYWSIEVCLKDQYILSGLTILGGDSGARHYCYRGVVGLLQRCWRVVTEVVKGCFRGDTNMLKSYMTTLNTLAYFSISLNTVEYFFTSLYAFIYFWTFFPTLAFLLLLNFECFADCCILTDIF